MELSLATAASEILAVHGEEPAKSILIAGLPGAGKSTLAAALADRVNGIVVDKDAVNPVESAITARLFGDADLRDGIGYRKLVYPHTIRMTFTAAEAVVAAGIPAVIDAPCLGLALRSAAERLSLRSVLEREFGVAPTTIVWVTVDSQTQHRRMAQRGAARDARKLADFDAYRASIEQADDAGRRVVDFVVKLT